MRWQGSKPHRDGESSRPMNSCLGSAVLGLFLVGCASSQYSRHPFRQAVGPGPGPGCASTMDCMCRNGSQAACEQLARTAPKPKSQPPVRAPVPGTDKTLEQQKKREADDAPKDRCADYYARCVAEGGEKLPGHVAGYTRCGSCLAYCVAQGFWPEAIYTWSGARLPCPGL